MTTLVTSGNSAYQGTIEAALDKLLHDIWAKRTPGSDDGGNWLRVDEAAERLGCSAADIHAACDDRKANIDRYYARRRPVGTHPPAAIYTYRENEGYRHADGTVRGYGAHNLGEKNQPVTPECGPVRVAMHIGRVG